jgi:16S rRNA processing protein RimM
LIAKISSAFGIKGEVKILVFSDDPKKLEKYNLFDSKGSPLKLSLRNKNTIVNASSSGGKIVIVKIEGVEDRNKAEEIRGKEIFAERKDFITTKKDEFYIVDLIGLDVVDLSMKKIGKVVEVFDNMGGGVVEVEFDSKSLPKNYNQIENFPFKNDFFPEVDLEKGFIQIDLPEIIIGVTSKNN